MGKLTIKNSNYILELFLFSENLRIFFCFFKVIYRLVNFNIEILLMKKLIYSQLKPNEQKIRVLGIILFFLASTLSFRIF